MPVEAATDDGVGEAVAEPELPSVAADLGLVEALENAIRPALERPPCHVLFSGGRDSSVILAAAVRVARRDGLPLPLPTTHVFSDHPETDELDWQQMVLSHLKLTEHIRQHFGSELNLLGPAIRESVRRHGVLAPAGAHLLTPTLTIAGGGSIVTGIDGDGVFNGGGFGPPRASIATRRPSWCLPRSAARAAAPRGLRRIVARSRLPAAPEWLRADVAAEYLDLRAREVASEPFRWDAYLRWLARRRRLARIRQSVALLAASHDVQVAHPFLDGQFLAVLARDGGAWGWGDRTRTLAAVFGSLLPARVLTRTTKAIFTRPYWGGDVKEFAREWTGTGLPDELVDSTVLRTIWLADWPDARTGLLLHAAWAASLAPDERPQFIDCRLE
jgi:Asparagine synthase